MPSVDAALLRPVQGLAEGLFCASQVLASALVRRHGFGSLAHRAGGAVANSVTMRHTASRALVAEWHIVTCHVFEVLWVWSVAKAAYRHCQVAPSCRVVFTGSAVVPVTLPREGRTAPTAGQPTPLLYADQRSVASVSWHGAAAPCQVNGPRLAIASCWRRCNQQRGHAGSAVVPLCHPKITTYASSTVWLAVMRSRRAAMT